VGGLAVLAVAGSAREADRQDMVRVGIVDNLFRGIPQKTVDASAEPFRALMEKETGRTGEMVKIRDAFDLAQKLSQDKVELGVFYGYEYAWVQQKYPKLRPLAVAVNQEHRLFSYLVVRKDSGIADMDGLKGKSLALPEHTKEYCLLFLDGLTGKGAAGRKGYFSKMTDPANIEDALDDVVDRQV
jgi:ABC-type phosphate/phosphonate transport system substrate-binding protein